MNIKQFVSQVSQQGLARQNRWVCTVYPPSGLTSTGRSLSNVLSKGGSRVNVNLPGLDAADAAVGVLNDLKVDLGPVQVENNLSIPTLGYVLTNMGGKMQALNLFTHACSIPQRDITTQEWSDYGERRKIGIIQTHGDLSIEYFCSEDLRERQFFEQWQDLIFNPVTKQHSYYKDYISRIEIAKYDASWKKKTVVYRFNEAYPSTVGALEMNSDAGDVLKLQVTFKYYNYEISGPGLLDKFKDKVQDKITDVSKKIAIFK